MIVKAGLFWWCIFVFVVVAYFIVEVLWVRYKGTAVVQWGLTFDFDGTATRKVYWEQFVEPSKWSQSHPVVQSAVISMVQNVLAENSGQHEKDGEEAAKVTCETNPNEEQTSDPLLGLKVVPFGPMAVNRGLTLRVRNGDMEGSFFCARLCTEISTPDEGPWTYTMKTVSTGPAYPYLSGTETSTMKMCLRKVARCTASGRGAQKLRRDSIDGGRGWTTLRMRVRRRSWRRSTTKSVAARSTIEHLLCSVDAIR